MSVLQFNYSKIVEFPRELELYERLHNIVAEYKDELSPGSIAGVLGFISNDVHQSEYEMIDKEEEE